MSELKNLNILRGRPTPYPSQARDARSGAIKFVTENCT